jgi:parvulin-like peptidyl-prolyl isomerase
MGIGEVSPVFSSFHGFHLAKVIEIQPSTLQPFEEVKDAVKDAWIQQTRSEKIEDYMEKLRDKAEIREIDAEKEGGAGESSSVD